MCPVSSILHSSLLFSPLMFINLLINFISKKILNKNLGNRSDVIAFITGFLINSESLGSRSVIMQGNKVT